MYDPQGAGEKLVGQAADAGSGRTFYPCWGCKEQLVLRYDPYQRLCPRCFFDMLESVAHVIDPTYDPLQEHEMLEVNVILAEL
jgi:hypothetical protein